MADDFDSLINDLANEAYLKSLLPHDELKGDDRGFFSKALDKPFELLADAGVDVFPRQPSFRVVPALQQLNDFLNPVKQLSDSSDRLMTGQSRSEYEDAIRSGDPRAQLLTGLGYAGDLLTLAMPYTSLIGAGEKRMLKAAKEAGISSEAGIFGGIKAKNAPLKELAKAKTAIEAGADAKQVWKETGWHKAPWDGQWRFEIPDNEAVLTPDWNTAGNLSLRTTPEPTNTVLLHNELRKNYPLQEISPTVVSYSGLQGGSNGLFNTLDKTIQLKSGRSMEDATSTLMHELQHGLQHKEGFATGKHPNSFIPELIDELKQLDIKIEDYNNQLSKAVGTPEYQNIMAKKMDLVDRYQELNGGGGILSAAHRKYLATPGEAEARLVQKRMNYTPQQRRDIFPLDDLDVPLDELLPADSGSGVAMSMPIDPKKSFQSIEIPGGKLEVSKSSIGEIPALTLHKIEIAKDVRNQGMGTKAMRDLIEYADSQGIGIQLTPTTDFGATSKARLSDFYKRFGFIENKGKNKNLQINESMYRLPAKKDSGNLLASLAGLLALGGASDKILNGE